MTVSITLPARAKAQLTASGIHSNRGGRTVLSGVDLTVSPQSKWGVAGENGRGKSTLLHILAGVLEPDAGSVQRMGSLGVAEQEMSTTGDRTVGDRTVGDRTVGDVIDSELADVRSVLRAFDAAAEGLSDDRPGSADAYAAALAAAETLDVWDADRRVDLALENLGAVTDRSRRLTELSVGQRYRVGLPDIRGPTGRTRTLGRGVRAAAGRARTPDARPLHGTEPSRDPLATAEGDRRAYASDSGSGVGPFGASAPRGAGEPCASCTDSAAAVPDAGASDSAWRCPAEGRPGDRRRPPERAGGGGARVRFAAGGERTQWGGEVDAAVGLGRAHRSQRRDGPHCAVGSGGLATAGSSAGEARSGA